MSRRNREKRAARQRDRRRASSGSSRFTWGSAELPGDRLGLEWALQVAAGCRCGDVDRHAAELLAECGGAGRELDLAADAVLLAAVRRTWEIGWAPADLAEWARRTQTTAAADFLFGAVVVESRRHARATVHPRWQAGVDAMGAGLGRDVADAGWLREWAERAGATRPAAVGVLLQVLAALHRLPVLEQLLPLPGTQRFSATASGEVDQKVLAKVRGLLAKAESTEFPDEAEALSAKAQELMSRYSLHQAVLEHDRGQRPTASGRRMWMDAPYPGAKVLLVQAVAGANRCRTVWREDPGFVTVIGPDTELGIVELLSTSLLLQASRAMLAAGRQVSRSGASRTRSFRQSFLVAYASRIGERLAEADTAATAGSPSPGSHSVGSRSAGCESPADLPEDRLLPVLAARSQAADEMVERLFPGLVSRPVSVSNAAGWTAGRAAADLARFDAHGSIAG